CCASERAEVGFGLPVVVDSLVLVVLLLLLVRSVGRRGWLSGCQQRKRPLLPHIDVYGIDGRLSAWAYSVAEPVTDLFSTAGLRHWLSARWSDHNAFWRLMCMP
ncbi:hypothetical protein BDY17DRAFT_301215, partial [Neohortaea acidophila]